MRVALTGATGFLGRHTVAALVAAGHEVVCISRSGRLPTSPAGEGFDPTRVSAVACDVVDLDALKAACAGADILVHGAGLVSNRSRDARAVFDLHVVGTRNAIAVARALGIRRLVLVSTSGTVAVGTHSSRVYDESSPRPIETVSRWPYYRTKLFSEEEALAANDDDLTVVSVNPSLLLGPGDDEEGASTHSVRTFLEDGMPLAPSGGLAFVDVRDAADGIVSALTRGRGGERYLLNGCNVTFFEFFRKVARAADRTPPMAPMPKGLNKALDWMPGRSSEGKLSFGIGPRVSRNELDLASHFWYCSWDKASEELGFSPRDPVETISDTVRDLLARKPW